MSKDPTRWTPEALAKKSQVRWGDREPEHLLEHALHRRTGRCLSIFSVSPPRGPPDAIACESAKPAAARPASCCFRTLIGLPSIDRAVGELANCSDLADHQRRQRRRAGQPHEVAERLRQAALRNSRDNSATPQSRTRNPHRAFSSPRGVRRKPIIAPTFARRQLRRASRSACARVRAHLGGRGFAKPTRDEHARRHRGRRHLSGPP